MTDVTCFSLWDIFCPFTHPFYPPHYLCNMVINPHPTMLDRNHQKTTTLQLPIFQAWKHIVFSETKMLEKVGGILCRLISGKNKRKSLFLYCKKQWSLFQTICVVLVTLHGKTYCLINYDNFSFWNVMHFKAAMNWKIILKCINLRKHWIRINAGPFIKFKDI